MKVCLKWSKTHVAWGRDAARVMGLEEGHSCQTTFKAAMTMERMAHLRDPIAVTGFCPTPRHDHGLLQIFDPHCHPVGTLFNH